MTEQAMGDFHGRAAEHRARVRATWRDTFLAGGIAAALLLGAYFTGGATRAVLLVATAVAATVATVRGTLNYIQSVDEQERDANLWGCYVGMCVYLVLFMAEQAARAFGLAIPHADWAIFTVTIGSVLAVYAWKRFR